MAASTPSGFTISRFGLIMRCVPTHHPDSAIGRATVRRRPRAFRQAHGLHASYYAQSVLIRCAAEEKLREADRGVRRAKQYAREFSRDCGLLRA